MLNRLLGKGKTRMMKLLVANDAHILKTPDGKHWVKALYGYDFWKRYLNVFDKVRIVARMREVESIDGKKLQVDGPGIEIHGLPFYQGPIQLAKKYLSIQRMLKNVDKDCDVAIMRMPSHVAHLVYKNLRKDIVLGGEIVYDPYDDLHRKGENLFMKLVHHITSEHLKEFCLKANGISYVTEHAIQKHYPSYARLYGADKEHFDTFYSSVSLNKEYFREQSRTFDEKDSLILVMSDVAMRSERKGEKILIGTVKAVRDAGYDVRAVIIGDGELRKEYEDYAKELDISAYVKFTGLIPSAETMFEELNKADVYVFPSNGEGLPRGILEAMAVGLPVISTPVGGIPEVIDKKYLINPIDVKGFSNEICRLMDNRKELNEMSSKNIERARDFESSILQQRRDVFFENLTKVL